MEISGKMLRIRSPQSKKGDNGRLVVLGGSKRYYGAPALVSLAALRTGTDIVYTIVPEKIAPTVASYSPDLIVWGYKGDELNPEAYRFVEELSQKADSIVLGNGLTRNPAVLKTAERIVNSWGKPLVLDADAIGGLEPIQGKTIYTPHNREFLRLTGKTVPETLNQRSETVRKEAKKLNSVILLKGPVDVISDGTRIYLNRSGNSAMTCGGTGDVLAGVAGGLLSQGYSTFDAARIGAYLNGLAGEIAYKKVAYSMRATDTIESLPSALMSIRKRI